MSDRLLRWSGIAMMLGGALEIHFPGAFVPIVIGGAATVIGIVLSFERLT